MVAVQRQPELLQIVLALTATGCFPSLLDGRQQQCNQSGNNGNHNQQFNQREATLTEFGQRTDWSDERQCTIPFKEITKALVTDCSAMRTQIKIEQILARFDIC